GRESPPGLPGGGGDGIRTGLDPAEGADEVEQRHHEEDEEKGDLHRHGAAVGLARRSPLSEVGALRSSWGPDRHHLWSSAKAWPVTAIASAGPNGPKTGRLMRAVTSTTATPPTVARPACTV